MKIELYHTTEELKRLFRKEKDSRISTRIRAVYLAQMGKTAPQIANLLGYSRRRIQDWIKEADPNVHVFMIWDQAGFHTSNNVKVPENVTLIPLPSYSPQLNPVEKLWQFLRQHYWSNRVYNGYDHLRQVANESWHKVCLYPEKIKSICRAKYIEDAIF